MANNIEEISEVFRLIRAGDLEPSDIKVYWKIYTYVQNNEIKIDKEVTFWAKKEDPKYWHRLKRKVIPLNYQILRYDEDSDTYIEVEAGNNSVAVVNNRIVFNGGFLQVEDLGLIHNLENFFDITLGEANSVSEFLIANAGNFESYCENIEFPDEVTLDPGDGFLNQIEKLRSLFNIQPKTRESELLTALASNQKNRTESLSSNSMLGRTTTLLSLIPLLYNRIKVEFCSARSAAFVGENIRIDANIELENGSDQEVFPIIDFTQNDNFTQELLDRIAYLKDNHARRNGNINALSMLDYIWRMLFKVLNGSIDLLQYIHEIRMTWLAYLYHLAGGVDLGRIYLEERSDDETNKGSIHWDISKRLSLETQHPFSVFGLHKITINEDRNAEFRRVEEGVVVEREGVESYRGTYFECLVDAIPFHGIWKSEAPDENGTITPVQHKFSNGYRKFNIGFDSKSEKTFRGKIKDIIIDPSSGCGGCH